MKKLILVAIVALFAMSCEGPMGPEGPQGRPGQDGGGLNWVIKDFTIRSSDWKLDGNPNALGSYYYCTKAVSELSYDVLDYGLVQGYVAFKDSQGFVEAKSLMPFVRHKGADLNVGEALWTETIDLEAENGYVTFYITRSDFITDIRPDPVNLELHLIW